SMPRTPTERVLWAAVSLGAGVGEEISYRGVFTSLLARILPLEVAVSIAVVAFTVAHAGRGWRDLTVIGVIAILMHGLVLWTGSLYLAMAVHFGSDLAAGLTYGRLGDKYGYPAEPLPPPEPAATA
ncbi:MAG: CPBP family intramembrane glutamic endopeptidase, partial [Gemmatimonadota bacterium]